MQGPNPTEPESHAIFKVDSVGMNTRIEPIRRTTSNGR
jgi:hypothetical protein